MDDQDEFYSVEQVAERLGLHVKTVRSYVRDGRLRAVRIGKQYRIAGADLRAFTGGRVPTAPRDDAGRRRHVEVSSVVQIDAIGPDETHRLTTLLMAATAQPHEDGPLRVESAYDEERARLRVIVLGSPAATADLLSLVQTWGANPT
jgi:excisionase family DNA binding protein